MADKIELEIVTPKGRALAESVDEVTAPSVQGEFGVLPGHLPMVAALRQSGGNIRYSEYPNGGHPVWDAAYGDATMVHWLLQQKQ